MPNQRQWVLQEVVVTSHQPEETDCYQVCGSAGSKSALRDTTEVTQLVPLENLAPLRKKKANKIL